MKLDTKIWVLLGCLIVGGCADPKARVAKHMEEGWTYFRAANFEKARVEFQNALQIDPKNSRARFALGQTFEHLGDLRNAMGHYAAAADDPTDVDGRIAMARIALLSGNIDIAKQRDGEALKLAPGNAAALAIRAGLEAASGDKATAEQTAKQALAIDPAESGAVSLLASLYLRSGRVDDAHVLLKNAIAAKPSDIGVRAVYAQVLLEAGNVDGSIEQLEAITRLEPADLDHEARLAGLLASAGRLDDADRRLTALVESRKTSRAMLLRAEFLGKYRSSDAALAALRQYVDANPKDSDLTLALAQLLESSGNTADAEKTYRSIADSKSSARSVSGARIGLAGLLLRNQRVDDAKTVLADILRAEPNNAQALALRGRIALAEGHADAAIADLRTALRDDPNSPGIQAQLAAAYRADNQPLMAKETLMAAVQVAPADADLRKELYSLAIGTREWDLATAQVNALEALRAPQNAIAEMRYRIAMGRGEYADAATLATTLVDDESTGSLGQFYRGAALQAQGKDKEAESAYHDSLAARPGAAEPLGALVRLYIAGKRDAEAVRVLQDTLAKSKDNVVALNLLGELELSSGRFQDAKASFVRAIDVQKTWWRPYRGLAAAQLALKDVPAAQRALEQGIESTGEPQLFVELGLMMTNARRFDDAIALYEKGLAAHPHAEVLANNLAMLLVTEKTDQASHDRALAIIDGLTGSSDPAVLDTVGWVNYKAGRLGDAKVYLDRAVAKLPTAPLLRYHQARVLADSGDSTGAKVAVAEALKSPQFSERDAAQTLSRQLEQKL